MGLAVGSEEQCAAKRAKAKTEKGGGKKQKF